VAAVLILVMCGLVKRVHVSTSDKINKCTTTSKKSSFAIFLTQSFYTTGMNSYEQWTVSTKSSFFDDSAFCLLLHILLT